MSDLPLEQLVWTQRFTGIGLTPVGPAATPGFSPIAGAPGGGDAPGDGAGRGSYASDPPEDNNLSMDDFSGLAAGFGRGRGAGPTAAGNGAVTPEVAAQMLENLAKKQPAFRPELGKVGGCSWFVTNGDPYTSANGGKSVTIPVEVANPTGKPPIRFTEKDLVSIRDSKLADARKLVESQVREETGKKNGEPLNGTERKAIERRTKQVAERKMWEEVGERTKGSESGIGIVELKKSEFSKSGDGEFTLTSRPEAVKVKGGTEGLLKIITEQGVPAEPEVVEAATKLAEAEKWAGRVKGVFRVGGKVLIVVGVALDIYKIYTARDHLKAAAEAAGGWTAATLAGTAFAEAFAPADLAGPVAWAIHGAGTLIVGGVAYFIGSKVAGGIYELVVEGDPIDVKPD